MATDDKQDQQARAALPDVITVVEDVESLKDKWKVGEIFLVGLGLGIPALIWDAAGGFEEPSPTELGAVELKKIDEHRERGDIRFDPGHPRVKTAYCRHPADPQRYVAVADYHRTLLSEKAMEATVLLLRLGAVDVYVRWQLGNGEHLDGRVEVSAEDLVEVASTVGSMSGTADEWTTVVQGAAGERRDLPDLAWLDVDPIFRMLIEAADARVGELTFTVSSTTHRVVDASLITRLQKMDISAGGTYKSWDGVRLGIRAVFTPQVSVPTLRTASAAENAGSAG